MRGESFSRRTEEDNQQEDNEINREERAHLFGETIMSISDKISSSVMVESAPDNSAKEQGFELDDNKTDGLENVQEAISQMAPNEVAENLGQLLDNGATYESLYPFMCSNPEAVEDNFDAFVNNGIGASLLLERNMLKSQFIWDNFSKLLDNGATYESLYPFMCSNPEAVEDNFDAFIGHGISADALVANNILSASFIRDNLDKLLDNVSDFAILRPYTDMYPGSIAKHINAYYEHGMQIDAKALITQMNESDIENNYNNLVEHGATLGDMLARIDELEAQALQDDSSAGFATSYYQGVRSRLQAKADAETQ